MFFLINVSEFGARFSVAKEPSPLEKNAVRIFIDKEPF